MATGSSFGNLVDVADRVTGEIVRQVKSRRYLLDPVLWAKDFLGLQVWSKQREIMESVRDFRNTACAAGHGVGKSHVASVIIAWWIDVHPTEETFVATTAPSAEQLTIIWDGVRKIHGLAKRRYDEGVIDRPLPGYITGDNKWKMPDGTILGEGRKPPDNKSDVAFQGRHATYLLAIGDEAVGLSAGFLSALGNIATAKHNRVLLLANPTDPSSAMAKLWKPEITNWNRIHISVFESPAIKPDPDFDIALAPALSGQEYVDEKKIEWGEDDPRYISRVKGEWAFDAGNTVYTAEELAKAKRTIVLPYPDSIPEYGWDIARMGADSTVGYSLEVGEVWSTDENGKKLAPTGTEGYRIRRQDKWSKAPLVGTNPDNPGSANRIHDLMLGEGTQIVKVDASGIGSAVVDGLIDLLEGADTYTVVEIFGGAPSSDARAFINLRAEMFFELKKDMHKGILDLDEGDKELFEELEGIRFEFNEKNVVKIESKESIRKRGRKSPDHADAVWYCRIDVTQLLSPYAKGRPGSKTPLDYGEIFDDWQDYEYGAVGTPL